MASRKKLRTGTGLAIATVVAVLLAYYMGDQANTVATSASFTIDTRDPDPLPPVTSPLFTIDTTDPDSEVRPLTLTTTDDSNLFTIDTRATDAPSMMTWAFSGLFTIDTQDPNPEDSDADGLHDLWEVIHFGSTFAALRDADPDFDGRSNFVEFATGTNPKVPDNADLAGQSQEYDGEGGFDYLVFEYTRHILATRMVDFQVHASPDLLVWTYDASKMEIIEPVT